MTKDECIRVAQQMVLSSYLEEVVRRVVFGKSRKCTELPAKKALIANV